MSRICGLSIDFVNDWFHFIEFVESKSNHSSGLGVDELKLMQGHFKSTETRR